jgi:hypothetical protein
MQPFDLLLKLLVFMMVLSSFMRLEAIFGWTIFLGFGNLFFKKNNLTVKLFVPVSLLVEPHLV